MANKTIGLPQNKCGPSKLPEKIGGVFAYLDMNSSWDPSEEVILPVSDCGGGGDTTPDKGGGSTPPDWRTFDFGEGTGDPPIQYLPPSFVGGILPPIGFGSIDTGTSGGGPEQGTDWHATRTKNLVAKLLDLFSKLSVPGVDGSTLTFMLQMAAGWLADNLTDRQNDRLSDILSSLYTLNELLKKGGASQEEIVKSVLELLGLTEGAAGLVAIVLAPVAEELLAVVGALLLAEVLAQASVMLGEVLAPVVAGLMEKITTLLKKVENLPQDEYNMIINALLNLGRRAW